MRTNNPNMENTMNTNRMMTRDEYMAMVREQEADRERARIERGYDKQQDYYETQLCKLESDEDYLRGWNAIMENEYDGTDYDGIWDCVKQKKEEKAGVPITNLHMLDKKARKSTPINVLKLITFLADAYRTKDLVYNNTWGICVRPAKKANFPMHTVLDSLNSIIVEGLTYLNGKEKEIALIYIDSAPMDSLLARAWDRKPTVTLDPVYADIKSPECSGVWEKCLVKISTSDDENLTETIPAEDVDFWRSIYATRKDMTAGIEYEVN